MAVKYLTTEEYFAEFGCGVPKRLSRWGVQTLMDIDEPDPMDMVELGREFAQFGRHAPVERLITRRSRRRYIHGMKRFTKTDICRMAKIDLRRVETWRVMALRPGTVTFIQIRDNLSPRVARVLSHIIRAIHSKKCVKVLDSEGNRVIRWVVFDQDPPVKVENVAVEVKPRPAATIHGRIDLTTGKVRLK